jgi:DNA-binding NtrC family response regulator
MDTKRKAERRAPASVVVVCSQEESRDVIAHWLTSQGVKVAVAATGYEAARALRAGARRLITDRVLPPWPGLDPFLELRSRYPDLGIVFIEGPNVHDAILARVTGAETTLPRPLTRQAVVEAAGLVGAK